MTAPRSAADPSSWPEEAQELWARVRAHVFDQPGSALPFTQRLARDNAWDPAYAAAVVEEYRRFCFLAGVAEHPVTPSDQVDQAWHLHLLYTRDYWQVFCAEALRFELHHGPTRGGAEQGETFLEQYSQTRHSYRLWFGEHPPAAIWPPAAQRFGRDTRWVRVNLDDWELVDRREPERGERRSMLDALLRRFRGPAVPLLAVLPLTAAEVAAQDPRPDSLIEAGWNPYALSALGFLLFFGIVTLSLAVLIPWITKRRLWAAGEGVGLESDVSNVFEAALLAGGEPRVLSTAVTWLVEHGHARIVGSRMTVESLPPSDAHPLVRSMAGDAPGVHRARDVMAGRSCRFELRRLREGLVDKGLLLPGSPRPKLPLLVALALPVVLALPRITAAMDAGRPFGYLFLLGLFAMLVAFLAWKAQLGSFGGGTEGARRILQRYAEQRPDRVEEFDGGVVAAAAMFGVGVLEVSDLPEIEQFTESGLRPQLGSSGNGGAGGCGGGGCGGGGCGGGGCGGCGGCGG